MLTQPEEEKAKARGRREKCSLSSQVTVCQVSESQRSDEGQSGTDLGSNLIPANSILDNGWQII